MNTSQSPSDGDCEGQDQADAPVQHNNTGGPLAPLVSMRVVQLFGLMQRSTSIVRRRAFGLTNIQWRIMTQVGSFAPLSLNGLADRMMQDRGQISRAVKGLVTHGLLTRTRKAGGPQIEISPTAKGRAVYDRMIAQSIERDEFLTQGIDPQDIETTLRVFALMEDRAEKFLAKVEADQEA